MRHLGWILACAHPILLAAQVNPNHFDLPGLARCQCALVSYGKEVNRASLYRNLRSWPVVLRLLSFSLCSACSDDGAHSIDEKVDVSNYLEGTKLLGTYLHEVAAAAPAKAAAQA